MTVSKERVFQLSNSFRLAIERSKEKGIFMHDLSFDDFPIGSCGDASYLLAEFLLQHGIETIWVSYRRNDWTHAWLVIKDDRVLASTPRQIVLPDAIKSILAQYGNLCYGTDTESSYYEENSIRNGIIIDITGDQFSDYCEPVFVGLKDSFHNSFDFIQAVDFHGLTDERLLNIYYEIERCL